MRSAEQIGRTVGGWHDHQKEQRERNLRALLTMLERARLERAEWYVWIAEGQPELTREQYAKLRSPRARGRRGARKGATVE